MPDVFGLSELPESVRAELLAKHDTPEAIEVRERHMARLAYVPPRSGGSVGGDGGGGAGHGCE
jgi:hypothetical protein